MNNITQLKRKDVAKLREEILEEQDGICPICKKIIEKPCLDHDHVKRIKGTGLIRGVLCGTCNVFIAKSENNCVRYAIGRACLPDVLRNMADYLERDHYPYMHPSEAPKPKKLKKSSHKKLCKVIMIAIGRMPQGLMYPKSETLTKPLENAYKKYNIIPEFYK